jgi:hypothetical protein
MNFAKIFVFLAAFSVITGARAEQNCRFALDQNSIQIDWTAFKTSQKVPVTGSFTEVTLVGELEPGKTLAETLDNLEAEILVNRADKIQTDNIARDQTLYQKFFSLFQKKPLIKGAIKKLKGTASAGTFFLDLEMNRKSLAVPMKYTRDAEGSFIAKGGIDLEDFDLGHALANLQKACGVLHRGPDGVSKTWPVVEIKLQAKITENCKP